MWQKALTSQTVAEHLLATCRVTAGDPGELRSCRKVVQRLPKSCSEAEIPANFNQDWPMLVNTWPMAKVDHRFANILVEFGRTLADIRQYQLTFDRPQPCFIKCFPTLVNIVQHLAQNKQIRSIRVGVRRDACTIGARRPSWPGGMRPWWRARRRTASGSAASRAGRIDALAVSW